MKITAIGDIHGRTVWQKIVEREKDSDKIIFIGDYLDTHEDINPEVQATNFENILQFKQDNPEQVELLLGNHDYHYLPHAVQNGVRYSGYQGYMVPRFRKILSDALDQELLQICYIHENIIFSHAGISKEWLSRNSIQADYGNKGPEFLMIAINERFKHHPTEFGFLMPNKMSDYPNPYGDNIWQSPLWIRPNSLFANRLEAYDYVCGHTTVTYIEEVGGIVLIDNLPNEYLNIVNGKYQPVEI